MRIEDLGSAGGGAAVSFWRVSVEKKGLAGRQVHEAVG
jgi:hypothetical protein